VPGASPSQVVGRLVQASGSAADSVSARTRRASRPGKWLDGLKHTLTPEPEPRQKCAIPARSPSRHRSQCAAVIQWRSPVYSVAPADVASSDAQIARLGASACQAGSSPASSSCTLIAGAVAAEQRHPRARGQGQAHLFENACRYRPPIDFPAPATDAAASAAGQMRIRTAIHVAGAMRACAPGLEPALSLPRLRGLRRKRSTNDSMCLISRCWRVNRADCSASSERAGPRTPSSCRVCACLGVLDVDDAIDDPVGIAVVRNQQAAWRILQQPPFQHRMASRSR